MSQHDNRHWNPTQHDRRSEGGQMDQFADQHRQQGGQGDDSYGRGQQGGSARRNEGMQHADRSQTSYGRYGAPDVQGQPTGGYSRPEYEPARRAYGQYERGGDEARNGGYGYDDGRPRHEGPARDRYDADAYGRGNYGGRGNQAYQSSQSPYGYGEGYEDQNRGRYQGGAGGYGSNAGPYAGSQTYGGYGDQTGYGSGPGYGAHDPDYQQWRRQQMQSLDADYDTWRSERYKKFADEFTSWRKDRLPSNPEGQAGTSQRGTTAAPGGGQAPSGTSSGTGSK